MKIAILTESASNLSKEYVDNNDNLFMVPLMIVIDGKSYRDQVEITADEVYEQIDDKVITTSLPNFSDLKEQIALIKENGFTDVLVINVSSGLSGTYNAFRLELEEVEGLNVRQYDSKTIGGAQGYLVEQAVELANEGLSMDKIIKALDKQRYEESLALYTISTLKYLKQGGRIGGVEATIGELLNIKPVIAMDDKEGVYITMAKSFGLKRALISMKNIFLEKFKGKRIDFTVHYATDKNKAEQLAEMMMKSLEVRNLTISKLTPILGLHAGPDMFSYIGRIV